MNLPDLALTEHELDGFQEPGQDSWGAWNLLMVKRST